MASTGKEYQDIIDNIDKAMTQLSSETKSYVVIGDVSYNRTNVSKLIELRNYYSARKNNWERQNGVAPKIRWRG